MKNILAIAIFLSALPCLAVTATPGEITAYMRRGIIIGDAPFLSTRWPESTPISVTGTGDWNISRGGFLASAPTCSNSACFNVTVGPPATLCQAALPTGNGPTTLYLCWRTYNGLWALALGTHTGTLTIGDTTINITIHVLPPFAYDAFTYLPGYPSGCSSSDAGYPHADTCTVTNERPTSTAFSIPAQGASYTDPQFGYTVTRITPAGYNIEYSGISAFNSDSSLVAVEASSVVYVYNRSTAALAYGPLPSEINITKVGWDALDPDLLRYMDGDSLYTRVLSTAAVTKVADYGASAGSRPAMATIHMGGTSSITDDNWWVFYDDVNHVCAVNLNGLSTSNQEAKTFCADIAGLGLSSVDFPQITKVDRGTGKRYVVLIASPAAQVFSVGATGLDFEYEIPTGLPNMLETPHSDVGEDADGNQGFIFSFYDVYGNVNYPVFLRLSAGTLLQQPMEIGGGMKFLYPIGTPGDNHWGSNGRGTSIISMYSNTRAAERISAVTAANPCQITTRDPHGYSTGNTIEIGGALGITSINGEWVITSTGANTFTLDGHNCTGTYTANSAHSAVFTAFSNSPNRQEIVVLRPGHEVRRVAIHRNSLFEVGTGCANGDACSYFNSPRASISNDGRYIAYLCNFGKLDTASVCVLDLGSTDDVRISSAVDPADTSAVLRYNVPADQGAATVLISASPSLTSPVVNVSDGLSAPHRQYVATGLTAATDYYYRVTAGLHSYTGRFRTLPTLSGTGTLRIERGGGGTIDHGATAALGSSGASPLVLTPSKGPYYYNAGSGVVATVVR